MKVTHWIIEELGLKDGMVQVVCHCGALYRSRRARADLATHLRSHNEALLRWAPSNLAEDQWAYDHLDIEPGQQ